MQLQELFEKRGIRFAIGGSHRHVRAGWLGVDCPWCGGSDKYLLGINAQSLACVCWKCGTHSLASVLVEVARCTPSEGYGLVRELRGKSHVPIERIQGTLTLPKGIEDLLPQHKRYLTGRGFDWQQIVRLWGVRGFGLRSSKYKWRLFLPVMFRGKTVSWTTRTIGNAADLKYLNSPPEQEAIPIKQTLYGLDYASGTIVLNEGPTDVWNVGPGAVACFGLNISAAQIQRIVKFPVRYVCFDNSTEAQIKAQRVCDLLSVFPGETYNIMMDAADPGSASKKEITQLRRAVFGA